MEHLKMLERRKEQSRAIDWEAVMDQPHSSREREGRCAPC
jgi:hypothetical protein